MRRTLRIPQIIQIISNTSTTRESITNLNKRCCLCIHSIETCIPNPLAVRKIQRRGLESQRTGIGDDLDVGNGLVKGQNMSQSCYVIELGLTDHTH